MGRKSVTCLLLLLFLVGVWITIPRKSIAGSGFTSRSHGPRDSIQVVLTADNAPEPGGVTTLRFEATPRLAAPDLRVRWLVPDGAELLGDPQESLGAVAVNETVVTERQVRFPARGDYRIAVEASYEPGPGMQFGAASVLFFTVQPRGAHVSDRDPDARNPMGSVIPGTITVDDTNIERAPNGDPCFFLSGTITRIDKPVTPSGFGPNTVKPLQHVIITVNEEDVLFDDTYGEVNVTDDGSFAFSFCDDDGWFDDELEIYIRIRAEARLAIQNYPIATVEDIGIIDEVYTFRSPVQSSEGGNLQFTLALDETQSAVFNILDAIHDAARHFWIASGNSVRPPEAEVEWEPGENETPSRYSSFWGSITIADIASDPDAWDDSVIIHEYGHQIDDEFSCDESPGGPHNLNGVYDPELAWSEGYPDYWQGVVRDARGDPFGSWYLSVVGSGSAFGANLETVAGQSSMGGSITVPNSIGNEIAIAGALWDLYDPTPADDDNQDRVGYGHARIQGVYLSDTFADMDNCNWDTFERAWMQRGNPADGPTAAAIVQNVNETELDGTPRLHTAGRDSTAAGPTAVTAANGDWWKKVVSVVDTSASMAGPKFDAVITVLREQVNDLAALPQGTEMALETFDNTDTASRTVFRGRFYPSDMLPIINSLTPSTAPDTFCPINGLRALSNAVRDREDFEAWLFTDGIQYGFPGADVVKQTLAERNVRASIALLGLCPPAASSGNERGVLQQTPGIARAYLGLAADETPGGLVPYLVTALASGGQFLFVDNSQASDAADILRAQITHSAGAGRWSDYVSDTHTYRFDRLTSWEYEWREPNNADIIVDPEGPGIESITLPQPFTFYGTPSTNVYLFQNGYVTLDALPNFAGDADWHNNRPVPDPAPPLDSYSWPHRALYPYWDDLEVEIGPARSASPDAQYGVVYGKLEGEWYVLTYSGFRVAAYPNDPGLRFQILLNLTTGEIRYQYANLPSGGAGSATIGLEGNSGFGTAWGLQVAYNDVAGAVENSGSKFTPAPPQPTKTFPVQVDEMMDGIAFLLTGYDGSFDPLVIRDPDGNVIACDAPGVLCLNLGLVQYVQANVDGRVGEWNVDVSAGPTGSGTFTFTSFAASALTVRGVGDRSLSFTGPQPILVDLGQPVDGNEISGYFTYPNGTLLSGGFKIYDDGQHGDGAAGDGLFAAPEFETINSGTGYLHVTGTMDGAPFTRVDPAPYTFHPLALYMTSQADNYGGMTPLNVSLHNQDTVRHCYDFTLQLPEGWYSNQLLSTCVEPGAFHNATLEVWLRFWQEGDNTLPSGSSGIVTVTVTEAERGIMSDSASTVITRRRPPASVALHPAAEWLSPGGDGTPIKITVLDEQGVSVGSDTLVEVSSNMGTVEPAWGYAQGGVFYTTFTPGNQSGTAVITARATNGFTIVESTTSIEIREPAVSDITIALAPDTLPPGADGLAQVTVRVLDESGEPVGGETVRIGAEDDGQWLMLDGSEVITGTTDANGRVVATLRRHPDGVSVVGTYGIRAERLDMSGATPRVTHEARAVIHLGTLEQHLFMPVIGRP